MKLCGRCFGDEDESDDDGGSSSDDGSDGGSDGDDDGTHDILDCSLNLDGLSYNTIEIGMTHRNPILTAFCQTI